MSRSRIVVSLADGFMTMDVMQRTPNKGIRQACGRWLAYLFGRDAQLEHPAHSITVEGDTSKQSLAILFQKGLDALKMSQQRTSAGMPLEVVLGPSLSRVGVLEMLAPGNSKLSDADKKAYVEAWVLQNWAVQPDECVLRWIPIGQGSGYLVTCIERHIVDAIDALCAQMGMRLSSCKPAVVNHLVKLTNRGTPTAGLVGLDASAIQYCAFIERTIGGGRGNVVQFLALKGVEPLSAVRMWLPVAAHTNEDGGIDEVVQRLRAQYGGSDEARVDVVRWPLGHGGAISR